MVKAILKDALFLATGMIAGIGAGFILRDYVDINLLYWILTGQKF